MPYSRPECKNIACFRPKTIPLIISAAHTYISCRVLIKSTSPGEMCRLGFSLILSVFLSPPFTCFLALERATIFPRAHSFASLDGLKKKTDSPVTELSLYPGYRGWTQVVNPCIARERENPGTKLKERLLGVYFCRRLKDVLAITFFL